MVDRASLTSPAGAHPLFGGVRRLIHTGFEAAPDSQALAGCEGEIAPGVRASFPGARVEKNGDQILVHLPR